MIASRIAHSRKKVKKYRGRAGRMVNPAAETPRGRKLTKVAPGDSFSGVNEMNKKVLELLNNQ
ncbi:hypothetical protein [Cytobacillus firmus]|uniref:Uncharacterized protein n=1 Tax=Cytobacillus firmus DS1 TaxID=1307436 RepID=W7KZL9_CYTFI|nr:hypothetical protein [Cytobacillus firmus]EWG08731.1 hypothetical protein PBF_22874 [Cytobacillus firmus DS1]MBG9587615.1 hypothetical protein [Cytobacillus firmus]